MIQKKQKRVLVIGGNRYVGAKLLEMLMTEASISILGTISRSDQKQISPIHFSCDRKDKVSLIKVIQKFKPNIIVDMACFDGAAMSDLIDIFDANQLSSLEHYIVISTFFVYNVFNIESFREKPLDYSVSVNSSVDRYTRGKIELERRLFTSKLMNISSVARFPFVFSSDDYTGRFQKMCKLSVSRTNNISNDNYRFSMVSKNFAASGIRYLVMHKPMGFIDFASTGHITSGELAEIIASTHCIDREDINEAESISPYIVEGNICSFSDKIPLREDLEVAIKREAVEFFRLSHED